MINFGATLGNISWSSQPVNIFFQFPSSPNIHKRFKNMQNEKVYKARTGSEILDLVHELAVAFVHSTDAELFDVIYATGFINTELSEPVWLMIVAPPKQDVGFYIDRAVGNMNNVHWICCDSSEEFVQSIENALDHIAPGTRDNLLVCREIDENLESLDAKKAVIKRLCDLQREHLFAATNSETGQNQSQVGLLATCSPEFAKDLLDAGLHSLCWKHIPRNLAKDPPFDSEIELRKLLLGPLHDFPYEPEEEVTAKAEGLIHELANFIYTLRNIKRGDLNPTAFTGQLRRLTKGLIAVKDVDDPLVEKVTRALEHVAASSVPPLRLLALSQLEGAKLLQQETYAPGIPPRILDALSSCEALDESPFISKEFSEEELRLAFADARRVMRSLRDKRCLWTGKEEGGKGSFDRRPSIVGNRKERWTKP